MLSLPQCSPHRHQETETGENPRVLVQDLVTINYPRDDHVTEERVGSQTWEVIYPNSVAEPKPFSSTAHYLSVVP